MRSMTVIAALALAGLGVGITLPAQAQETSPTPPRRPPQRTGRLRGAEKIRTGERLEKLRDLSGRLVDVFSGDPAQQPKAIDVARLNDGIVALLKPLFENEPAIESFKLGFDPEETNFANDTARLIASARLKHSAWSSRPSQVELAVSARYQRGAGGKPQARLEGQLDVSTEVVPLANHAVAKFLARTDPARSRGRGEDPFVAQAREFLGNVGLIESMDDLVDCVVGLAGLRLKATNDEIVELARRLESDQDDASRQKLQTELAQARLQRDMLFDVRPRVERDAGQKAVAIHFTLARTETPDAAQLDRLAVKIAADSITVDAGGAYLQGLEAYALLKPLVANTLARIQDRDPEMLRQGQGILGGFLRDGRDAVLEKP